jgi:hypothetical protein
MLIPKEEVEQIALVQWLKLKKIPHFSVPNENLFTTLLRKYLPKNLMHLIFTIEKKLKDMGEVKGTSDLFIFLDNCLLIIELKRKPTMLKNGKTSYSNSKVSQEQLDFIEMANKYPYAKACICYGYADAIKIIEELR